MVEVIDKLCCTVRVRTSKTLKLILFLCWISLNSTARDLGIIKIQSAQAGFGRFRYARNETRILRWITRFLSVQFFCKVRVQYNYKIGG